MVVEIKRLRHKPFSVLYYLVMFRQNHIALMVGLVVMVAVLGADAKTITTNSTRAEVVKPSVPEDVSSLNLTIVTKKSSRPFVNTSIPFSVAPQPVKDTLEVAQAKESFLATFSKIEHAVFAADNLTNRIDDEPVVIPAGKTSATANAKIRNSFAPRGPAPFIEFVPPKLNLIYPDPQLEPEYFLPSVHVDPLLLSRMEPPLPPNPFIHDFRPISDTCYEIIVLEPEDDPFQPAGQALQILPLGTPALPNGKLLNAVPHFKAPQLSFFPGATTKK